MPINTEVLYTKMACFVSCEFLALVFDTMNNAV